MVGEGQWLMSTHRTLVWVVWLVMLLSPEARAEFGMPYVTPAQPIAGETVSFNIYQGGCDGIAGTDPPAVTQDEHHVYVLAQGVRYTNPELCTLTYGTATYPLGAYPAGDYTMQLDLRYPSIGGDFVIETLGVVNFRVGEGVPTQTAIEVPTVDPRGLIVLALLISLSVALRLVR